MQIFPRTRGRTSCHGSFARSSARVWSATIAIVVALAWIIFFQPEVHAQTKPIRRILILNEVGTSYPLTNLVDEGMRSSLANSPYHVEFYREYMDTVLFPDSTDQRSFETFYVRKYQDRRPDVIITVGSSPLNFMAKTHQKFFPGVPVVFCFANTPAASDALDSDFTGVQGDVAPAATVAAVLRLLPNTKQLVVVGGVAPYDRQQQAVVKQQLKAYANRLDISYLTDLPTAALLQRLKQLPPHTVVLLTALGKDVAGVSYNANESGPMVVDAANAPVFSLVDRYLNHGEVGGDLSSATEEGKIVGHMALRILNGERPEQIPTVDAANEFMFDWRALTRWGLKEKDLPPGSIVLNRELTFWEAYKWYVIAGILVFLAQTLAILGLTWQRARRRKAEVELRKSEERFSKSFRLSPLVVTITSKNSTFIEVNETFEEQSGWKREEVLGRTPGDLGLYVESDERLAFEKQLRKDGNSRNVEIKVRRRDGQIRTALVSAEVIEVNNEPCVLSLTVDITERKQAEDALSSVSRRLIEAHEEERTRIARELHDDVNLRLAMAAVNLKTLKQDLPSSEFKARSRIEDLCNYISDLASDVQALSHRLHSSKLDYLGLEAACASFCKELSQQHDANVTFHSSDVPDTIPTEISLSLFRILQEALHNAVKHSGVREFDVILAGAPPNEIRLSVRDLGTGFNPTDISHGQGLGLTSMRERLKLVHGTLSIDSKPQQGTTILACVSLARICATSERAVAQVSSDQN